MRVKVASPARHRVEHAVLARATSTETEAARCMLLIEHQAGQQDLQCRQAGDGLVVDELDEFVIHQVSQVHTQASSRRLASSGKKC